VIAAKVFEGCSVTMGGIDDKDGEWPFAGATGAVGSVGCTHVECSIDEIHTDAENKIVTAPAFMNGKAPIHKIHDNVGQMVKGVLDLID